MNPDRRQSSPEYREMIGAYAQDWADRFGGDYDAAVEYATERYRVHGTQGAYDVLALLTRRAATVNGLNQAGATHA